MTRQQHRPPAGPVASKSRGVPGTCGHARGRANCQQGVKGAPPPFQQKQCRRRVTIVTFELPTVGTDWTALPGGPPKVSVPKSTTLPTPTDRPFPAQGQKPVTEAPGPPAPPPAGPSPHLLHQPRGLAGLTSSRLSERGWGAGGMHREGQGRG